MITNFYELVAQRQSDRSYEADRPVERKKIERILDAARLAPSACNAQPWKIIVVDEPELKNQVADATSAKALGMNHFAKQAPVHLVIVEESANLSSTLGGWVKQKHFPHIDLGILAEHLCLAAVVEGLGTCMIGWFDENKIRKLLDIPKQKRPILIITLGYSTQEIREKKRKAMDEIVGWNKYF